MPIIPDSQSIQQAIPGGARKVSAPSLLPNIKSPNLPNPQQHQWTVDRTAEGELTQMKYAMEDQALKDRKNARTIQVIGQAIGAVAQAYGGYVEQKEKTQISQAGGKMDVVRDTAMTEVQLDPKIDPKDWQKVYAERVKKGLDELAPSIDSTKGQELFRTDSGLKAKLDENDLYKAGVIRKRQDSLAQSGLIADQLIETGVRNGNLTEPLARINQMVDASVTDGSRTKTEAVAEKKVRAKQAIDALDMAFAEEPEKLMEMYAPGGPAAAKDANGSQIIPEHQRKAKYLEATEAVELKDMSYKAAKLVNEYGNGERDWESIQAVVDSYDDPEKKAAFSGEIQRLNNAKEYSDNQVRVDNFDRLDPLISTGKMSIQSIDETTWFDGLTKKQRNSLETSAGQKRFSIGGGEADKFKTLQDRIISGETIADLANDGSLLGLDKSEVQSLSGVQSTMAEFAPSEEQVSATEKWVELSSKDTPKAWSDAAVHLRGNKQEFIDIYGKTKYLEMLADATKGMNGEPVDVKSAFSDTTTTKRVNDALTRNKIDPGKAIGKRMHSDVVQHTEAMKAAGKPLMPAEIDLFIDGEVFKEMKKPWYQRDRAQHLEAGGIDGMTVRGISETDPGGYTTAITGFRQDYKDNPSMVNPDGTVVNQDAFISYYITIKEYSR